jgi:hypothetical protein
MSSANTTLNLDEFNKLTINWTDRQKVYPQIFTVTPTLKAFKANGMVKVNQPMGKYFDWRIKKEHLPDAYWVSKGYVHPLITQDIFDSAIVQRKKLEGVLTLYMDDVDDNEMVDSGLKIANMMKEEFDDKLEVMGKQINTMIHGDNTNPLQPPGLRTIVSTSRSYGGIDSTSYTWWDPMVINSTGFGNYTYSALADPTSDYRITKLMEKAVMTLGQYGFVPDNYICIGPWAYKMAYGEYASTLISIQHPGEKGSVDLSVGQGTYAGIPIIGDADCYYNDTSGGIANVYLLPKDSVALLFGKSKFGKSSKDLFTFHGWKEMDPQQSSYAAMLSARVVFYAKTPAATMLIKVDGDTVNTVANT